MIKGFKGFDQSLKCRGYQFQIGGEFEESKAKICNNGFHFCENPLDLFGYYQPADSRYAEVEGDGITDRANDDSKIACTKLRVGVEIKLSGLVAAGVKFILDRVDWKNAKESNTGDWSAATNTGDQSAATNTGNRSAATNTGDWSAATNTGDWSAATNTGDRSAATNTGNRSAATNTGNRSAAIVEGKESVAIATGFGSKAKGALGCWIVLAEWYEDDEGDCHIKDLRSTRVDGDEIKADTFYRLTDGHFVEVTE